MAYIFTDKSGIEGTLIDAVGGGVSGAVGRIVYNKVVGKPLLSLAKSAGKYADLAASYIYAAAVDWVSERVGGGEGYIGNGLKIAAYVPFSDAIGRALGDPAIGGSMAGGASAPAPSGNPWGGLNPVPLKFGAEIGY